MTCSEDGTVRIWDATAITQKTVIKPTLAKQQRTAVTACSYSSDGTLIGAGLIDGSIQIWNVAGMLSLSCKGWVGPLSVSKTRTQDFSGSLVCLRLAYFHCTRS